MSLSLCAILAIDSAFRRCVWCHREVDTSLWKRLTGGPTLCPLDEREQCAVIGTNMRGEPPEPEPEHPDRIPPEDITDCDLCDGTGIVYYGWEDETCRSCSGTGERVFP